MNTTILLLIFGILSSCVSIPNAPIHEVNFVLNRCLVKCYNWNKQKVVEDKKCGDDFEGGSYPIEFCSGVTGPKIEFLAEELMPAIKYNIRECQDKKEYSAE